MKRTRGQGWCSTRGQGKGYAFLLGLVGHQGDACVPWPMFRSNGYGQLGHLGKMHYAHRLMCELAKGPPPSPAHEAAHSCGQGANGCVNPNHLSWKTTSENQRDRAAHGTKSTGSTGKVSPEQAAEIRALKGKLKQREVADLYGISRSQVSWIQLGRVKHERKLTREQVEAVRASTETTAALARQYGLNYNTMRRIRVGKTYRCYDLPATRSSIQTAE